MAENSSTVGGDAISGDEALSDRPPTRVRRSSSNLFTPGKIPGKGNSLASPPYLSKVSLDAGGTGDTALGELGKYEEAGSFSVLEGLVKLAPLSLLVLESVLFARSLMLFVRDRLPLLEPGRTNSLNFSHLRCEPSPFFFGVASVTITRRESSHS